jgi:hypothetical protein
MAKFKEGDYITHKSPSTPMVCHEIIEVIEANEVYNIELLGRYTISTIDWFYRKCTETERILYG